MTNKKKYGWDVKIATLLIIVVQYSMTITSPILGTIGEAFAGQGYDAYLKQIETIGTLIMVVTGLGMGFLLKKFSKKTLLIIGTLIMMVFGFLPFLVGDNFWGIFISRAVLGFGMGIIYPFAASYIIDLFDGKERDSLMGIRSTVGAVSGILYAQASVYLAMKMGYKGAFLIPLVLIPILLFFLFKIPKDQVTSQDDNAQQTEIKERRLTTRSWVYILGNVFVMIFCYTFMTNVSIIVISPESTGGLGLTPAVAGNIMSIFSVVMAVSGLLFSPFFLRIFKYYTTTLGILLLGIGLMICYFAGSSWAIYLGGIVFGFGFQVYNASFVLDLSTTTKAKYVAYVTAIFFSFNGIGQYLSSSLIPIVSRNVLSGNLRGDWFIGFIGLAVVALVAFAAITVDKKRGEGETPE